jgi:hypothetical protein
MEDLDIDPCYEGVLRYLVNESDKERQEAEIEELLSDMTALLNQQDALLTEQDTLISCQDMQIYEMENDMKGALESLFFTIETVCTLCGWILQMTDENRRMSRGDVKLVRGLRSSMQAILRESADAPDAFRDGGL